MHDIGPNSQFMMTWSPFQVNSLFSNADLGILVVSVQSVHDVQFFPKLTLYLNFSAPNALLVKTRLSPLSESAELS